MYASEHFRETRADEILRVVTEHPLGALVTAGPGGLDAAHLPFWYDPTPVEDGPHGVLRAHVARGNPLAAPARDGEAAMVVFRGGQHYVSPNWYPSKHETHRQVPTWNYQVVHLHGVLRVREDERFVRGVMARLTRSHELATGAARPWRMGDTEPEHLARMLAAVVGVEIPVRRIEAVSKLSQNKDARDRDGVVDALQARGQAEAACAIVRAAPRRS